MNEGILNPYTIITVLCFLGVFVLVAFFVRRKSVSLKKIINNKKINIIEYSPIRGGYSAIIFSIENEKFFFVGHKSGHSNLVQILKSPAEKDQKFINNLDLQMKNDLFEQYLVSLEDNYTVKLYQENIDRLFNTQSQ